MLSEQSAQSYHEGMLHLMYIWWTLNTMVHLDLLQVLLYTFCQEHDVLFSDKTIHNKKYNNFVRVILLL
jgi:hypothetical protein